MLLLFYLQLLLFQSHLQGNWSFLYTAVGYITRHWKVRVIFTTIETEAVHAHSLQVYDTEPMCVCRINLTPTLQNGRRHQPGIKQPMVNGQLSTVREGFEEERVLAENDFTDLVSQYKVKSGTSSFGEGPNAEFQSLCSHRSQVNEI